MHLYSFVSSTNNRCFAYIARNITQYVNSIWTPNVYENKKDNAEQNRMLIKPCVHCWRKLLMKNSRKCLVHMYNDRKPFKLWTKCINNSAWHGVSIGQRNVRAKLTTQLKKYISNFRWIYLKKKKMCVFLFSSSTNQLSLLVTFSTIRFCARRKIRQRIASSG